MGRNFVVGLSIGSLWLIVAGLGFGGLMLALTRVPAAHIALAVVGGVGVLLVGAGVGAVRQALALPRDGATAGSGPTVRKWFLIVFGAEIAAIVVVNAICGATRHFELIVPLDLVIVGLHFFPLARLFGVPTYHALGAVFCALPIATLALVAPGAQLGAVSAWNALPTFGCAAMAIAVGAMGLRQAWRAASRASR